MLKRIMLAVTFVGAFSATEFGISETAEARDGWRRVVVGHTYGPAGFYYGSRGRYGSAYLAYHGSRNHGRFYQRRNYHYY